MERSTRFNIRIRIATNSPLSGHGSTQKTRRVVQEISKPPLRLRRSVESTSARSIRHAAYIVTPSHKNGKVCRIATITCPTKSARENTRPSISNFLIAVNISLKWGVLRAPRWTSARETCSLFRYPFSPLTSITLKSRKTNRGENSRDRSQIH